MPTIQHHRGGYGRPPAQWLLSEKLGTAPLTFREVSKLAKTPNTGVRKLCERYAEFLRVKHDPTDEQYLLNAKVNPKRLRLLHKVLLAQFQLKVQMRWAQDGRENALPSAFARFLSAARLAGYRGLKDLERRPLPNHPDIIDNYWAEIRGELGV
jgi:hypothetical protein